MYTSVDFPYRAVVTAAFPAVLLAQANAVDAAGLGKAQVLSAPGQILNVRVELIMGLGDKPRGIKAAVASPAIPKDDPENMLYATVESLPRGRAQLTVRSIEPVNHPKLDLVVAVSSRAGRAYREYPLVLLTPKADKRAAPEKTSADSAAPAPAAAQAAATGSAAPAPATAAPIAVTPVSAPEILHGAPGQITTAPLENVAGTDQQAVAGRNGEESVDNRAWTGRMVAMLALAIAALAGIGAAYVALRRHRG